MEAKELTFEVAAADFDRRVIEASHKVAVIVDFWAPWCGPCRFLEPALERVVEDLNGKAVLARVNVDENQELASRFGIQSIPAVKVFRGGQVAGEFVGALPEHQIRTILAALIPSEADELVAEGDMLVENDKADEARQRYRKALDVEPRHAGATLALAKLTFEEGRLDRAAALLKDIDPTAREHDQACGLLARIGFAEKCQAAGGLKAVKESFDEDPADLDRGYDYACCLAAAERYREALEAFLQLVRADRHYRDDAAKDAMVRIFSIVGQRSPLADDYRARLSRLLY